MYLRPTVFFYMILFLLISSAVGLTCFPGTYINNDSCTECPMGRYSVVDEAVECTDCPANTFQNNTPYFCTMCPIGYTSDQGSGECLACSGTTCCDGYGLENGTCQECESGRYSNNNICQECPAGSVPIVNRTSPFNYITSVDFDETGSNACYACASGKAPQFGICLHCPKGQYAFNGVCTACSPGHFKSNVTTVSCSQCPAGFFTNTPGAEDCQPCPQNEINTVVGSATCSACPPLNTTTVDNGTSITVSQSQFSPKGAKTCHTNCDAFDYAFNVSGQCVYCSSGQYTSHSDINDQTQCESCPLGYVKPHDYNNVCVECVAPMVSNDARDLCIVCPEGQDYSNKTCQHCAAGTYKDTQMNTCDNCDGGTFQDEIGQASCKVCPEGRFSPEEDVPIITCADCPSGFIASQNATSECFRCTAGKGFTGSTTACSNCSFGTETVAGLCVECSAGKQGVHPNGCETCPYGQVSENSNSSCQPCSAGRYFASASLCGTCNASEFQFPNKVGSGSTYCIDCPPNSTATCQQCSPGTFNEDGACKSCAAGLYNDGQRYCQECPETSIPNTEQTGCETCLDGTYKSSLTACTDCPLGYVGTDATCAPCPKGQYQDQAGELQCKTCDILQLETTSGTGSTDETDCKSCEALGSYSATVILQGTCSICQAGKVVSSTKASCENCPLGRHRASADITCLPCPIGTYSDDISPCKECAAGRYTSEPGQSSCQNCAITNNEGCGECSAGFVKTIGNSCEACTAGQFSVAAQENCQVCAVGLYQDQTTSAFCKGCPAGLYNDEQGAVECKACALGRFQPVSRQGACHECPKGQYADQTGSSACTKCADGYFTQNEGSSESTQCEPCPAGRFENEGMCYDCPESNYQDELAKTGCKSCPDGEIGPMASTNVSECFSIDGMTTYVFGMKSDAKETQQEKKTCEIRPNLLLLCPGCTCDSDSRNGFWDGPICDECQRGFATRTCTVGCPAYDGQHDSTMCNGKGKCWFGKYGNGLCYCGGLSKIDSTAANAVVDLRLCPKGKICPNYGDAEQVETSYRPIYYIILYRQLSAFVLQLNQYTPDRGHMWFQRYAPNKAYENTCLSCVSAYESNIQTKIGYWSTDHAWQYFHDDIQSANGFHGENCQYECGLCMNGGKCNNVPHPYRYSYTIENTFRKQKTVTLPTTTCVCSSISYDSSNMCCPNGFQPYIFFGVRGSTPYTRFTRTPYITSLQNRQREYWMNRDMFLEPDIELTYSEPDSGFITVTDQNGETLRPFSEVGPYNKHVYYGVPKDMCRACPGLFGRGVKSQGNLIDTEAKAESFWWDNAMGAMSRKCNGIGVCDFYKKEREPDVHFMGNAQAYVILAEHRVCNAVAKTGYVTHSGNNTIDTVEKCAAYAAENSVEWFAFTRTYKGGVDADFGEEIYLNELSVSKEPGTVAYASFLNGSTTQWKRLISNTLPVPNSDSIYTITLVTRRCAIFDSCDAYATYYGFNTYRREKGHGDLRLTEATFDRFDTCFTFTFQDKISVFGLYVTRDYVQGEDPFLGGLCPKGHFCTIYDDIGYKEQCPAGYYQEFQGVTRTDASIQCSKQTSQVSGCKPLESTRSLLDYVDNVCKRCPRNAWSAPGSAACSVCPNGRVKKLSGDFDTQTRMLNFPTSLSQIQIWYYQSDELGTLETDCALVPESIVHIPAVNSYMSYDYPSFLPVISCPYGYSSRAGTYQLEASPDMVALIQSNMSPDEGRAISSIVEAPYMKLKKTFSWQIQEKQFKCSQKNSNQKESDEPYSNLDTFENCKSAAFETVGITDVRRRYNNLQGCYYLPELSDKVAYFGIAVSTATCASTTFRHVQYFCMEGVNNDALFRGFVISNCFRCPGNSITGPESGACTTCFANQMKWYTKNAIQQATELNLNNFKRVGASDINVLTEVNNPAITYDLDNVKNIVVRAQNTFEHHEGQWLRPTFYNPDLEITLSDCYLLCQSIYDAENLAGIAVRQDVPTPVPGNYNGPLCYCATAGSPGASDSSSSEGIVWYQKSDADITDWDTDGLPLCSSCQPGTKNSGGACEDCPEGYYTPGTKEANRAYCLPCDPGTFQNGKGQPACYSCSAGQYQATGAKTECQDCPRGWYDDSGGSATQCKECLAGQYQDTLAQTGCKGCLKGQFQNQKGQGTCKVCLAGKYEDRTQSSECKPCAVGRAYSGVGRQAQCDECGSGTYQSHTGQSTCEDCPQGWAQSSLGQSSCTNCENTKSYATSKKSTACQPCTGGAPCTQTGGMGNTCPAGHYLESGQYASSCKPCKPNHESTSDRTSCSWCPSGQYSGGGEDCKSCGVRGWTNGNQYFVAPPYRFKRTSSSQSSGWSATYSAYFVSSESHTVRFQIYKPDDVVSLKVKSGGSYLANFNLAWNLEKSQRNVHFEKGQRGEIILSCDNRAGGAMRCQAHFYKTSGSKYGNYLRFYRDPVPSDYCGH